MDGNDVLCEELDDEGTCWNARVTSCIDILDGGPEPDGGGVSPSSDFTSCNVNGTAVKSSAMPSREFTAGKAPWADVCDHTAFKCSGSGALAGDSLLANAFGDFIHDAALDCADTGTD